MELVGVGSVTHGAYLVFKHGLIQYLLILAVFGFAKNGTIQHAEVASSGDFQKKDVGIERKNN